MSLLRAMCILLFAAVTAKRATVEASSSFDDLFNTPNVDDPKFFDFWPETRQAPVLDKSEMELAKAGMGSLDYPGQPDSSSGYVAGGYPPTGRDRTWPNSLPPYTAVQPGFTPFVPPFNGYKLAMYTAASPPGAVPMQHTSQLYPSFTFQNPNMPPMHQVLGSGYSHPYSALQPDNPSHQAVVSQQTAHPNDALKSLSMLHNSTPVWTSNSQSVGPTLLHAPEQADQPNSGRKPQATLPEISSQALKGISKRSSVPSKQIKKEAIKTERQYNIRDEFFKRQRERMLAFGKQEIVCEHCKQTMKLSQASDHYKTKHPGMGCKEMAHCDDSGNDFSYQSAADNQISKQHRDKFDPPIIRIEKAMPRKVSINKERRDKIRNEFSKQKRERMLAFGKQNIRCEHCKQTMKLSQASDHYKTKHPGMGCKKMAHCDDCGVDFPYSNAAKHQLTNWHWNEFELFYVLVPGK